MKRRGGQAAEGRIAAQNLVIARSVHVLMGWGYRLRRQISPTIARAMMTRGRRLSSVRVEQLYEVWRDQPQPTGWIGVGGKPLFLPQHRFGHIAIDFREAQRPRGLRLDECVTVLLDHDGNWPGHRARADGDAPYTKAYRERLFREMPRVIHELRPMSEVVEDLGMLTAGVALLRQLTKTDQMG